MENKKLNGNNFGQVSGGTIETGSKKYYTFTYRNYNWDTTTDEEIANFLSTEAMNLYGLYVSTQQILNTRPGISHAIMSTPRRNNDSSIIKFRLVFDSNNHYIGVECGV